MMIGDSQAATRTWNGRAGDYKWSSPGNWVEQLAPVAGDDVVLTVGEQNITNDISALSLTGLIITTTGAATLDGEAFALTGNLFVSAGGVFHFKTGLDISSESVLTFEGRDSYLDGVLSGNGALIRDGSASLALTGMNTYTGSWKLTNGITHAASPSAQGNGGVFEVIGTKDNTCVYYINCPMVCSNPLVLRSFGQNAIYYAYASVTNLGMLTFGSHRIVATGKDTVLAFAGGVQSQNEGTMVINSENSGVVRFCGPNQDFGNTTFYCDLGTVELETPVRYSQLMVAKAMVRTTRPFVLDPSKEVRIGIGYGHWGTLDLAGCDQRVGGIKTSDKDAGLKKILTSSTGPATFETVQTSTTEAALYLNGGVSLKLGGSGKLTLFSCVSETSGALIASNGTLTVDATASFPNLSEIRAEGTGHIDIKTSQINPGSVRVVLKDSGVLNLGEGVELFVDEATVGGQRLMIGEYGGPESSAMNKLDVLSGTGTFSVIRDPIEESGTYIWTGAGENSNMTTAANWKSGTAPLLLGSDVLFFSEGTDHATFGEDASAYGIRIETNASFALTADADVQLRLQRGGLRASAPAGVSVTHTLGCNLDLGGSQTWEIDSNVTVSVDGVLSGGSPFQDLIKNGAGALRLSSMNTFTSRLIISNGTVLVTKNTSLGSTNRTILVACPKNDINLLRFEKGLTNDVSIRIDGHLGELLREGKPSSTLVMNGELSTGPDENLALNHVKVNGTITFRGGVTTEKFNLWVQVYPDCRAIIEEKPIRSQADFTQDDRGTLCLFATNNTWANYRVYGGTLLCENENVLAENGALIMGVAYNKNAHVDLNGFNQRAVGISSILSAEGDIDISSPTPAMLTLTGSGPLMFYGCFLGNAGLKYAGTGQITFCFDPSTTAGPLEIESGTVCFQDGAGWVGSSNITVSGGQLSVAVTSSGCGLGDAAHGYSTKLRLAAGGRLKLAAGVVETVSKLYLNGKPVSASTYGGTGSGARHILPNFFTGSGVLNVCHSDIKGMIILVR